MAGPLMSESRAAIDEAGGVRARAQAALARAGAAQARAQRRRLSARQHQLVALVRGWESTRRCFGRTGAVCMAAGHGDPIVSVRVGPDDAGHAVMHVAGEVDIASEGTIGSCLGVLITSGCPVVVDLAGVPFIDARGVAMLIRAYQLSEKTGTTFSLSRPSARVARVLRITGVDTVIPIEE